MEYAFVVKGVAERFAKMTQRRRQPLVLLEKERLAEINEELRISGFSNAKWLELGLSLGLSLQALKTIETDYGRPGASRCLMECLEKWLSRADNVTGPLSWITLANGLCRIGETSSAEMISKLSDPASGVFQRYSVRLSAVSISEESVDLLCTERLISNETRTGVESVGGFLLGDTLREIRTSITEDHNKLRALGDILLKSDEAKTIGQGILKECDELFPEFDVASTLSVAVPPAVVSIANNVSSNGKTIATSVATPVTSSTNQSTLSAGEFFFNAAHKPIFNEVRGSFGILIDELVPLIAQSIPSAEKMKSFLQRSFPELSVELSNADDIDDIMSIIVKKCRVNDISIIKTIVKRFKITEANPLISEYEDEVKVVCGSLKDFLSQNQPEHFNDFETIQFTLGWEPDEHSLDDIRNLLEEAFKELNKRIIVRSIHRGNSIIIICYAPHHLLAALFLEAQDNLTVLKKEFHLIRLTIGHYTVYDKRIRYKVMNNECLAEEIKLADGEEQELRTLLDYKEGMSYTLLSL
uniref:Death domain-containing protein n=1 Tax=Amphimedon queenslandica TaxID=400682 RepID=A0A1X7UK54_AMPQE